LRTKQLHIHVNDLPFAFRRLWQLPGFTLVGILTLALGISATTAVFSRPILVDPMEALRME
jgi:hypothetical protein